MIKSYRLPRTAERDSTELEESFYADPTLDLGTEPHRDHIVLFAY
jgi:hypothetical protein